MKKTAPQKKLTLKSKTPRLTAQRFQNYLTDLNMFESEIQTVA
jgi:hypothetical protein